MSARARPCLREPDPRAARTPRPRARPADLAVARVRFRDTDRSTAERTLDVLALAFEPPRWVVATWLARQVAPPPRPRARPASSADPQPRGCPAGGLRSDLLRDTAVPRSRRRPAPDRDTTRRAAVERVPRALLPTGDIEPAPGGGALLRVRTTRPEIVDALAKSLSTGAALHSARRPWPNPERRRSLTRRASSASPRGSSRSPSPSPAPRSSRRSPTTTGRTDTAERKFTRDKDALKRLGFHLETEELGGREEQVGYSIDARSSSCRRSTSARTRLRWSGPRASRRSGSRTTRSATSWRARSGSSSWARRASRRARPRPRSSGRTGAPTKRSSRSWSRRGSGAGGSAFRTCGSRRRGRRARRRRLRLGAAPRRVDLRRPRSSPGRHPHLLPVARAGAGRWRSRRTKPRLAASAGGRATTTSRSRSTSAAGRASKSGTTTSTRPRPRPCASAARSRASRSSSSRPRR